MGASPPASSPAPPFSAPRCSSWPSPWSRSCCFPTSVGPPRCGAPARSSSSCCSSSAYAYCHLSTPRLGRRGQPAAARFSCSSLPLVSFPLVLPHDAAPGPDGAPALWLLRTLAVLVGLPFVVVATTGPLLQRWYSWTAGDRADDPYFLFAASNLGSFVGLLAYPLPRRARTSLGLPARAVVVGLRRLRGRWWPRAGLLALAHGRPTGRVSVRRRAAPLVPVDPGRALGSCSRSCRPRCCSV